MCVIGSLGAADEESLVRISDDKLPGNSLAFSMRKMWEQIRTQKDLNLPAHKVHFSCQLFPLQKNMLHFFFPCFCKCIPENVLQ